MNNKQKELHRLVDIAVECCATEIDDAGTLSVTKEDVLGKNRTENVVMTRCVLICLILHQGYSIETCAKLLDRTKPAIRHLEKLSDNYFKTSRAYRIAMAEATLKVKDLDNNIEEKEK